MLQDEPLIKALQKQNVAAFKTLVIDYSGDMVTFASRLLQDPVQANDKVNDLLLDLYNTAFHNATSPLRTFLFERIRLACIARQPDDHCQ
jgi:DNA-directed RNA polymerase specialized sigma24 family protein